MEWTFIVTYIVTLIVLVYSFRVLPKGSMRWLFVMMLLAMASYKFYDVASDAVSPLWLRHIPVYFGEVLFYFFLVVYGKKFIEIEKASTKSKPQNSAVHLVVLLVIPAIFADQVSLFSFVSEQGLPHILTLPLFILFVSLVRLRYGLYISKYRTPLNWFIIATTAWIMIHVSEFLLESQQLSSLLGAHVEWFEFGWFCIGAILFLKGLASFKKTGTPAND